jgi:hypothetical protein
MENNKNNLLIIGYYYIENSNYHAYVEYLKQHFATYSFFPLMELMDRLRENSTKHGIADIETIISGKPFSNKCSYTDYLVNHEIQKDVVIVTHSILTLNGFRDEESPTKGMCVVKFLKELQEKYGFKLFLMNWDPKLCYTPDAKDIDDSIIPLFDKCYNAEPWYQTVYGNCHPFLTGYNKTMSSYVFDRNYVCDILFVGTNLYVDGDYPNKTVCRKAVVDTIYADKNIKMDLYGNDGFRESYPDAYRGVIPYNKCRNAFSNAKICLNISHYDDKNETCHGMFLSDRVGQILGCDSIVLSNNDYSPLLIPDVDYIHVKNMDELMPKIYYFMFCKEHRLKMKRSAKSKKHLFEYEGIVDGLVKNMMS